MNICRKLKYLSLASLFSLVKCLRVRHFKCSSLGQAPGLTHRHQITLKRDKHSSLLLTIVNYGRKKFQSIDQNNFFHSYDGYQRSICFYEDGNCQPTKRLFSFELPHSGQKKGLEVKHFKVLLSMFIEKYYIMLIVPCLQ